MITTFQQHVLHEQKRFPGATTEFSWLVSGITLATKMIESQVRRAGLTNILGSHGEVNVQGEVQQSSDTTYRVYDWDRPASAGRKLHVEESVAVTDPRKVVAVQPAPELRGTAAVPALVCPYFELEVIRLGEETLDEDTRGETFHLLTLTEGEAELFCDRESVPLGKYETALVAGGTGAYRVRANEGGARLLRASVPARCSGRA